MANLTSKITAKALLGSKAQIRKLAETGNGKPVFAYRIVGHVIRVREGETEQSGPFVELRGTFEAQRHDGEVFAGGKTFLPGDEGDSVAFALERGNGDAVDIAYDIFVEEAEKAATGYAYIAVALRDTSQDSDVLGAIKANLPDLPCNDQGILPVEEKSAKK